jgi:Ca2+-binding EF-hand superfamily protein
MEGLEVARACAQSKKDRMLAYFRIIDKDNSGTIDAGELGNMMRRVNKADLEGLSEEDAKEALANMVSEILAAVDANEDGVIEWEEFKVLDF